VIHLKNLFAIPVYFPCNIKRNWMILFFGNVSNVAKNILSQEILIFTILKKLGVRPNRKFTKTDLKNRDLFKI
jgi:hypothetical protein